ncbi:MAG: prolipoprotein diacylglyceryl transferase [Firmicutes bacterium]|nr:prolipoprotein diacylglyceryl transferase [Bacillota bacterium]
MDPVAFSIGPLDIRWYGLIISVAFAIGIFLALRETQRQGLDTDHTYGILLWLIPAAIIGARLYYVIFSWHMYADDPISALYIWHGGLAIHGGVIAGILVAILYCRRHKLKFLQWADIFMPSLVLGQAMGRWGNFFNTEAYGREIPADSFWSWIPMQVYAGGAYHHPTFLYESIWDLLVFFALLWMIRQPHRHGHIFACYLILYSCGRFFIESLRTDSLMLGPLRVAMLVSSLGVLVGVLILDRIKKNPVIDFKQAGKQAKRPPQKKSASKGQGRR